MFWSIEVNPFGPVHPKVYGPGVPVIVLMFIAPSKGAAHSVFGVMGASIKAIAGVPSGTLMVAILEQPSNWSVAVTS